MTSTAVCIATRVLSKPDVSAAYHQWLGQDWPNHLNTVWHALLLSFAYLVGSSTLFLTVIKEDGGLPLLPNKEQLTNEAELRKRLKETVATARDLPLEVPDKPLAERVNQLSEDIQEAKQAVDSLRKLATKLGRVQFYREIVEEFDALRLAAQDVAGAQDAANVRNKYWSATAPANLNPVEVERRRKVQRHAGLSVVG